MMLRHFVISGVFSFLYSDSFKRIIRHCSEYDVGLLMKSIENVMGFMGAHGVESGVSIKKLFHSSCKGYLGGKFDHGTNTQ